MMETLKKILLWIVAVLSGSLATTVLYYIILSLIFPTDVEKRLSEENRLLRRELPGVERSVTLLRDDMEYLEMRDGNIYRSVFKADAPDVDALMDAGKAGDILSEGAAIDSTWRRIYDLVHSGVALKVPVVAPVKGLNYTNVGASTGDRMNPFYKVKAYHDGVDIIAPQDSPVYATASGYVTKVQSTDGGRGNMVEITHDRGYVTRYAHLSQSLVTKGAYVRRGTRIGLVGDSGRAFTTHLHYELHKGGKTLDPVYWFGGSSTHDDYFKMLIMSASSGQSMD